MVTRLDNTGGSVKIDDVLVDGRIAEEDVSKVVPIGFAVTEAHAFDTHTRPKCFQMSNVWFTAVPTFKGGLVSLGVDEPVMEINGMEEGGRPEFGGKTRTIEKSANLNRQRVVVYFSIAILGGTIRPSGFNDVSKVLKHGVTEGLTSGKFAALVCPDKPIACTIP
jgi:hypothetical protein